MCQIISTKLCCNFLLRVLILFSFTTTIKAIFWAKDCKLIMSNNTQCECLSSSYEHFIKCPAKVAVPQITARLRSDSIFTTVTMESNDIDSSNSYKLLPVMDIGSVDQLELLNYPLSSAPITHLLQHLGLKHVKSIYITLPADDLKVNNVTRLSGLTDLKFLTLHNIDLSHVSADIFMGLPNLTWLSLSSANIQYNPYVFTDMENLIIKMNSAHLLQLPMGIFCNQQKLEMLAITHSQLQRVSKDLLQGLTSLRKLDLKNNTIESVQQDVFSTLTHLEEIDLSYNALQALPSKLFAFNRKLRILRILGNRVPFKTLPMAFFGNLRNLALVDITCGPVFDNIYAISESVDKTIRINCGLRDISADLFINSPTFSEIFLNKNELVALDATLFAQQFNLFLLDLSHNRLQTLPDELFRATKQLVELNLSYNQLTVISSDIFSTLYRLKKLYMENNCLKIISPIAFFDVTSLKILHMANNRLNLSGDTLSNTKKTYYLQNELSSPFQFLVSLQTLNLRNNSLSYIPSDLYKMPELMKLDLSHNIITTLNNPAGLLFQTKNQLSINLSYNQISKVNFRYIRMLTDSLRKTTTVELTDNPLECDCNLLQSIHYIREIPQAKLKLKINELIYNQAEDMKLLNVHNIAPEERLCSFSFWNFERCPSDCICWVSAYDLVLIVNCSSANLTVVPPLPSVQKLALKSIELHVENNRLSSLPAVSTIVGYADVTKIYAAGNNLSQIVVNNLPLNLKYLDLSRNQFTGLVNEVLQFFNQSTSPRNVALSENPWNCTCESRPLMAFITNSHKTNTTISDIDNINCTSPTNYKMTDYLLYHDICQNENEFVILNALFGSILLLGFSFGLCAAFYYKYQTEIKIWLYKYRIFSYLINEEELDKDKTYDAFICYSHKDEHFIAHQLVPELEEGPIRFKLCVHVRDFVIGDYIPDQIVRAIDDSKRTIIVLSENFINSAWALLEFRLAHKAGLNEGRARVIVVVYGEIGDMDSLDTDLQAYLKMTTYLEWGNPWFWDRLRYAMPHPSRKLNNLVQHPPPRRRNEDDKIELKEIPMVQISLRENNV